MNKITTESNIGEILGQWPKIAKIFVEYHMSCPGCYLSSFEILEDALNIYGIPVEQFLSSLNGVLDTAEKSWRKNERRNNSRNLKKSSRP